MGVPRKNKLKVLAGKHKGGSFENNDLLVSTRVLTGTPKGGMVVKG